MTDTKREGCCGHTSDCAVHNEPAETAGECDCGHKDELTVLPEVSGPDDHYPPKGTPETALVVTLTPGQYHVVHHTGRYFHAQVECAGFQGEEVGIDDVPDEPGVWYFSGGKPWTGRDWETGVIDDGGISGEWREATPEDFKDAGLKCPMSLPAPQKDMSPVGEDAVYVIFDGPPGPEAGRFVEVHDSRGRSVGDGRFSWVQAGQYWTLGPLYRQPTTGCNWRGMGSAPHDGETFLLDRGGSYTHAVPCFRHLRRGDNDGNCADGDGWTILEGRPDEGGFGCASTFVPDTLVDDEWRWLPMSETGR